jgi:hypothetical protein
MEETFQAVCNFIKFKHPIAHFMNSSQVNLKVLQFRIRGALSPAEIEYVFPFVA